MILLCALLLAGCTQQKPPAVITASPPPETTATATQPPGPTPDPAQKTTGFGFYFDTVVTVTLYGAPEGILDEIWATCERYENLLSKTVEGSDVSRINAADGETVTVDVETWQILKRAKEISAMTDGAFSVTIAPLSAMWDFTGGTKRMPTDDERIAAVPLVDDQKLTLGENNTVTLPKGMMIDLGGIAKGYIADQVAALLEGRVFGAILSLGGNVYVLGDKPDGTDNSIGIQDPWTPGGYLGILYTKNNSVVTSGTYERYFEKDGVKYHHILDPKDGLPARSDLVSASFVMKSSMTADALATACIVMGHEKAMDFVNQHQLDAIFIDADGKITFSEHFGQAHLFKLMQ